MLASQPRRMRRVSFPWWDSPCLPENPRFHGGICLGDTRCRLRTAASGVGPGRTLAVPPGWLPGRGRCDARAHPPAAGGTRTAAAARGTRLTRRGAPAATAAVPRGSSPKWKKRLMETY